MLLVDFESPWADGPEVASPRDRQTGDTALTLLRMTVGLFVAAATPVLAHSGAPRTTWPTPHTGWRQASCIRSGSRFCSAKPRAGEVRQRTSARTSRRHSPRRQARKASGENADDRRRDPPARPVLQARGPRLPHLDRMPLPRHAGAEQLLITCAARSAAALLHATSTFSCNSASDLSSGRAHPSLPLDFASATASVSAKGSALLKTSIRVAA